VMSCARFPPSALPVSEMNRAWVCCAKSARSCSRSRFHEQGTHDYRYGEASGRIIKASNVEEATPLAVHLLSSLANDDAPVPDLQRGIFQRRSSQGSGGTLVVDSGAGAGGGGTCRWRIST
jgi:hypothetical protein